MTNYHHLTFAEYSEGALYTIEVKPKYCRCEKVPAKILKDLPKNTALLRDNPTIYNSILNSSVMDFDTKQVQKLLKGEEKLMTNYSPLKMFSGDRAKMLETLRDLRASPQANLKMHKNGKRVAVLGDDVLEVLAEILIQSKILDYIKELQCCTDKTVEEAFEIFNTHCKNMPEEESKKIIEKILPKCFDKTMKLTEKEKHWHEILKFLYSMSARDCSVMVTFCALNSKLDKNAKLGHGEALVKFKGRMFTAKVGVIDLDVKLIKKMDVYYSDKIRSLTDYIKFFSE